MRSPGARGGKKVSCFIVIFYHIYNTKSMQHVFVLRLFIQIIV